MSTDERRYTNPEKKMSFKIVTHANGPQSRLELEARYEPNGKKSDMHCHPHQHEKIFVLTGRIDIITDSKKIHLKQGGYYTIKPGEMHTIENSGKETAIVNWQFVPALNIEDFLKEYYTVAGKGMLSGKWSDKISILSRLAHKYKQVIRIKPAKQAMLLLFGLLMHPAEIRRINQSKT